jgi:hypothetical protein
LVKKIRSFQVLSPLLLLAGEDNEEEVLTFLQDDPVHLTKEGYAALCKEILARTDDGTYTRRAHRTGTASHAGTSGGADPSKNPAIYKRKAWDDKDDTMAHRNYGTQSRGGTRGVTRGSWTPRGSRMRPYGHGDNGCGGFHRSGPGGLRGTQPRGQRSWAN